MSELKISIRCDELFDEIPCELEELFSGVTFPWEVLGKIKEV